MKFLGECLMKYTLSRKESKEKNVFVVTICADSNDADYITEITNYSKKEFDDWVIDELITLKNNFSQSHELENYRGDLNIPYNGFDGNCHSLDYVKVEFIDDQGEIWTVEY